VVHEEKKLIVGFWPPSPPSSNAAGNALSESVTSPQPPVLQPQESLKDTLNKVQDPIEKDLTAPSNALFDALTAKEKEDPHSVDLLESNDVLENEISLTEEAIASLEGHGVEEEDELLSLQCRLQILKSKMDILVYRVQNDVLSLPDYLESIRERMKRDQALAQYLRSFNDKVFYHFLFDFIRFYDFFNFFFSNIMKMLFEFSVELK
jgi:hypothetical protein